MLLLQSISYFSRNLNSFALFLAKLWSEIYFMRQYPQIYLIMVLRWKISWRHKMTSSYWIFLKLSCNSTFPNILLQWIFGDNCIIFRKVTRYENSDTCRQNSWYKLVISHVKRKKYCHKKRNKLSTAPSPHFQCCYCFNVVPELFVAPLLNIERGGRVYGDDGEVWVYSKQFSSFWW